MNLIFIPSIYSYYVYSYLIHFLKIISELFLIYLSTLNFLSSSLISFITILSSLTFDLTEIVKIDTCLFRVCTNFLIAIRNRIFIEFIISLRSKFCSFRFCLILRILYLIFSSLKYTSSSRPLIHLPGRENRASSFCEKFFCPLPHSCEFYFGFIFEAQEF